MDSCKRFCYKKKQNNCKNLRKFKQIRQKFIKSWKVYWILILKTLSLLIMT